MLTSFLRIASIRASLPEKDSVSVFTTKASCRHTDLSLLVTLHAALVLIALQCYVQKAFQVH